jgi:hypothetical protein
MIRRYLQELRRISQAMHFIKDNSFALEAFQKALRVIHFPTLPRQLAIEIFDVLHGPANRCFPCPSHTRKPNYRTILP